MKKVSFKNGRRILLLILAVILTAALLTIVGCSTASSTTTTSTPATSPPRSPTATTTQTPTATGTISPTATATVSPTATLSPSPTATVSPSPTATGSPSPSPTGAIGSVEVIGQWGGEELASFQAMVAPWEQQTGGKMNFTGTRDTIAILTTRIQAGNPPDVAILPNPGQMRQLAAAGNLKPLSNLLDMTTINAQYPQAWTSLATVNDQLYGMFMKATNKGMIWYNPKTFSSNSWSVPTTWTQLIDLSNQIVSDAKTPANPWSVGVESAQASGWPGTDWIAEIFLSKYGGDAYDQWVNHQIPWTDSRIKDAWNMFGTIVNTPNYIPGGTQAVLATNFQDASYLPFLNPPKAAMYYEGDFVQGFISTQFPSLVAGQDYSFFNFPTINDQYKGAIIGGADVVVAFKDNPTVRSFVSYLATPAAQDIWVKRGGFTSVNNQISISDYPNELAGKSAQQLLNAGLFRYGAGDIMPSAMQTAWWQGMLQYLQNPNQLDSILANLENTAKTAYSASPTPSATP
jgi:alpha-glucoside transport system substrate-binding protein